MARVPDVSRRAPRRCFSALLLCAAGQPQANQEARGGSTTNWPTLIVGKMVGNCPHSSGQADSNFRPRGLCAGGSYARSFALAASLAVDRELGVAPFMWLVSQVAPGALGPLSNLAER